VTLPVVARRYAYRGVEGPAYVVGPNCSTPFCTSLADHAHHLFRRTALGGPFDWVEIDSTTWQNKTAICWRHHQDLTGDVGGHKAAIRFVENNWLWCEVHTRGNELQFVPVGRIEPQPLTLESLADGSRADGAPGSATCPTCGHVKRRRLPIAGRRRRKSWRISVPDDGEDGAEVLDNLTADLGVLLDIEPTTSGRYYILVYALAFAHQHRPAFLASLDGVGG
jgi:hypothetical protein